MEFRQLQTFTAVVENNSFSRAAAQLQTSQPTVSLHIQQLEEELGVKLIVRTTKSFEITSAGQKVYEYARDILRLENRLKMDCSDHGRHTVHLGACAVPAGYILPEVLSRFSREHPDIRFVVEQADLARVMEKLESGLIDLGLADSNPDTPSAQATPFCLDEIVLITPATDRFRQLQKTFSSCAGHGYDEDSYAGEILNLLLREPFILQEEDNGSVKAVEQAMEELGVLEEDLHITARLRDAEAIKNMVSGGLGLSILSSLAVRNDLEQKHILAFHFPGSGCLRRLYLLQRSGAAQGEASEVFRKYLLDFYRSSGKRQI